MPDGLSGHLIKGYHPESPFNSSIVTHGPMSFNPMMHGTPYAQHAFSQFMSQPFFSYANDSISEETARKIATLQAKLDRKLGPEYISQRPGPGGGPKLTYVEGWKIINLANEVFGYNGWSSSIVSLTTDFVDYSEETRRYSVGVTAIVRVTLKDGVFHEDTGYGMLENSKSKGTALDKCKKEAVTDGLKRALRNFGNVLGNCLYDKSYTSEVIKVKFEPVKFNKDELHRRPEFDDVKPNISSISSSSSSSAMAAGPSNINMTRPTPNQVATPTRLPVNQNQAKPLTSIPPHMRSVPQPASNLGGSTSTSHVTTPVTTPNDAKGKAPVYPNQRPTGLNTPITTPVHPPAQRPNNLQQNERQESLQPSTSIRAPPVVTTVSKPHGQELKLDPDLDDDESFGFGSEDDAFFALADLGPPCANDADLGRPIESDLENSRPIDQEEGLLQSLTEDDADESAVFAVHPSARAAPGGHSGGSDSTNNLRPTPPSRSNPQAAQSRRELIAAALRGEGVGDTVISSIVGVPATTTGPTPAMTRPTASAGQGLAAGMLSKVQSEHPQQQQTRVSAPSSSALTMPPPPPPQGNNANRTSSSISQQNHQRYMNQKQVQNQNQPPVQTTSTTTTTTAVNRASTTSSMGGFHFPPGVNPIQQQSSIGIKRPFDATTMSNSSATFRSARQGMGLQHATSNVMDNKTTTYNDSDAALFGKREVLGALDIEEGGNVKRARR